MHFPLRGQADPRKATRAFADAAVARGATVRTGCEVTGIARTTEGTYRVTCTNDEFSAQRLILAAGAWCGPLGEMMGLHIPIVPVRGQMWATQPLPPRSFHSLSSAESYAHWSQHPGGDANHPPELTHIGPNRVTRHLYGRQNRDGEIIFGGDREVVDYDYTVDAGGVEVNFGHASEILPMLAGMSISRTWVGDDAILPGRPADHREEYPQLDEVYIVSGLASSGFGPRADGGQAHRRLRAHGPSAAGFGGVRARPLCHHSGVTAGKRSAPGLVRLHRPLDQRGQYHHRRPSGAGRYRH